MLFALLLLLCNIRNSRGVGPAFFGMYQHMAQDGSGYNLQFL
jgi:hypothetical protein